MIMIAHCPSWLWPMTLVTFTVATGTWAQVGSRARYLQVIEPKWLRLQITDVEAGAYAEGVFEETTYKNSGQTVRYERFFVAPTLGLSASGSVYHPNLLQFALTGEGAYGWSEQRTESLTTTTSFKEWQYYGRFHGNLELFPRKPLRGSLSANYGRSYREYDFFSRATVDSLNYGGQVLYTRPMLALLAKYERTEEEVFDVSVPSQSHQDLASFDARHDRQRGSTGLNYTYNQYTSSDDRSEATTVDHTVALTEAARFGRQEQVQLTSGASYTHRDSDLERTDQISANANVRAAHRHDLSSAYDLLYDRFVSADLTSDSVAGTVGLSHQLYKSLTSGLTVAAADSESSADSGSGYSRRYGGAWSETYTKRLGATHWLRLDNTLAVDHVEEQVTGRVVNERHTFPVPPNIESFILNLANVSALSIVLTDASGLPRYVAGIDYELLPSGSRTEIRRIPGGTIPAGSTVLVDYEAEPTPAGGYEQYTEACGFRLSFWNNFWGLYGRLRLNRNNAEENLRVQEVTSYTLGTDCNWRWGSAGAEFVQYESDDTAYRSVRLFESFSFRPEDVSSLGVDFSQAYTEYYDTGRDEQNYRGTARYRRSVARDLLLHVAAGVEYRHGTSVDQTRAVFRPELRYRIGRSSIQFAYNYEYNLYLDNEERNKHQLTLTIKRDF
jgi:hypothetical protein